MYSNGAVGHGDSSSTPMPPALTQRVQPRGDDGGALPLEPFRFLRGLPVNRVEVTDEMRVDAEPEQPAQPEATPAFIADLQGSAQPVDEDGTAEPAFQEDVSEVTEALRSSAEDRQQQFPVNAFIIPDHARRVPTGLDQATVDELTQHDHELKDPTRELAERFERLSRRLRAENLESLVPSLAKGDRFDALVAGFLAGYFTGKDD